jgi:hypothetical protein
MKPEQRYANISSKVAREELGRLALFDENTTIGEIRKVLEERLPDAKQEEEDLKQHLTDSFKGKCLRIVFSPDHVEILNIVDIMIINKFGVEAILIGNRIELYKNDITFRDFKEDDYASQYFPNKSCEEFPHAEYELLEAHFKTMVHIIGN